MRFRKLEEIPLHYVLVFETILVGQHVKSHRKCENGDICALIPEEQNLRDRNAIKVCLSIS